MSNPIWNSIRNFFVGKPPATVSSNNQFQQAVVNFGNLEVYSDINTQNAIDQGFQRNSAVNYLVTMYATKFASVPRYLVDVNSDTIVSNKALKVSSNVKLSSSQNGLQTLLNRPNEYQGQDSFLAEAAAYYKLTGECFIWLNRGDTSDAEGVELDDTTLLKKPVLEMYVLPSNYIRIIPDPYNVFGVLGYIFMIGSEQLKIPKANIIQWKNINMNFDSIARQHMRGLSPLTPASKIFQQNGDVYKSILRMIQNDGVKTILVPDSGSDLIDITPGQADLMRKVIDDKVNNNDLKGAVTLLQTSFKAIDLSKSVDMDLLGLKDSSIKDLCMAFSVPYELVEASTTFSNKLQAFKGWVSNSIIPDGKKLDDELNRMLLMAFGLSDIIIVSDPSELPEMREDRKDLIASLQQAYWLTANEKRIAMGYNPIQDPLAEEMMLPTTMQPSSFVSEEFDQITAPINNPKKPAA